MRARWFTSISLVLAAALGAALASCGGDSTGPSGVGTVRVTPALDSLPIGATVALSATVLDASGSRVAGATVFWNTANPSIATVSSSGVVTAIDTGTVQIAASSQGVSGFATITVEPKPVAAVNVTPPTAVIKVHQTVHLQANPVDAQGNPLTGRVVTWQSSDPTVATVDDSGVVTGVSVGPATITAMCEGKSGSAAISVGAPTPASIAVNPTSVSITVGQTSQLTATVKDSNNAVISGASVTWTIDKPAVASVSSTGLVTGLTAGTATITATSGPAHTTVPVTIAPPPPNAVVVSPSSATLFVTQSVQLTATVTDAAGQPLSGQSVTWSSANPTIASVDANGLVHALLPGTATINATNGSLVGHATITVKLVPTSQVGVSPDAAQLFVGQTQQLTAVALDSVGDTLTNRAVTWSSTNTGVARVTTSGLVTAAAPGSAVIIAKIEGQTGTASITVSLVPVRTVTVTPALDTVIVGAVVQETAALKDSAGNTLTGRTIDWTSSDQSVAVVSSSGRVVTVGAGTVTITATSEGVPGTATIVVLPVPVSTVVVAPATASIVVGGTQQFTDTLKDASGAVLSGRVVAWTSSDTTIATVDATTGLATGVAAGAVTITATSEGKSGKATLTVTPPPVATVSVTPPTATIAAGATQQFAVALLDAKGDTLVGRTVTWSVDPSALATIDATGLATGVAAGTVTITATSEGKTGTATLTVTPPPVATVVVSPPNPAIDSGATQQFSATLLDAKGNTLTGRTVAWSSDTPGVATIDPASGLATSVAPGTATITATSEGQSGSTTLTVTVPPVSSGP